MKPKVLITGVSGFIGRHCPRLLEESYEVHGVGTRAQDGHSFQYHQIDLLDDREITQFIRALRPEFCLHLAWVTDHGKYWTSDLNYRWVQSSLSLYRELIECGVQRVVTAGTCAEYDWTHEGVFGESQSLSPKTVYGVCKAALYSMSASLFDQSNVSWAWGRVFHCFGPFEKRARLIPSIIISLLENRQAQCSSGNQIRDFLYVEDLALAFCQLLGSKCEGAFNLSSGEKVELGKVIQLVGHLLHKEDLVALGARPDREGEPRCLVADVKRAREELKCVPKFDLKQGLQRTIDWWKKDGLLPSL
jgi:nucleoside-diphosphate-sugar epimerase